MSASSPPSVVSAERSARISTMAWVTASGSLPAPSLDPTPLVGLVIRSARGARLRVVKLTRQLKSDRHADEHPQTGLLGDQRPHLSLAGGGILVSRRLAHRLL